MIRLLQSITSAAAPQAEFGSGSQLVAHAEHVHMPMESAPISSYSATDGRLARLPALLAAPASIAARRRFHQNSWRMPRTQATNWLATSRSRARLLSLP